MEERTTSRGAGGRMENADPAWRDKIDAKPLERKPERGERVSVSEAEWKKGRRANDCEQ